MKKVEDIFFILPKNVSFLKMVSSTYVNKGKPAASLPSFMTDRLPALPCEKDERQKSSLQPVHWY